MTVTDDTLDRLRTIPKHAANSRARWVEKPKSRTAHRQRDFQAQASGDDNERFSIFQRWSIADDADFSCGIRWMPRDGKSLILARYNGPSHVHGDIVYRPHIHRATEKAIREGRRPESEAEETERYSTVDGALACLLDDFNVSGIKADRDEERLPLPPP